MAQIVRLPDPTDVPHQDDRPLPNDPRTSILVAKINELIDAVNALTGP